jgi:NAD(P)-dependent dehydrogenase (short-subunit alcohol dehydrogenase family)
VRFFITGGSRGIGAAIVREAAAAGHDVAFTYRTDEASAHAVRDAVRRANPSARVSAYRLDVRDSTAVEGVGDAVLDELGGVDVVVANAGVNVNGLAASLGDDEWHEVIETNLSGSFYVARQFLPQMVKNRFGRLVFVSSMGWTGVSGQVAYAASKAGLLGLSSTLSKEYGRRGITSNVIVPGFFETDMTDKDMSQDNRKFWLEYCPLGRLGELGELSQLVLFLASKGGGFINGEAIHVTGGLDWAP